MIDVVEWRPGVQCWHYGPDPVWTSGTDYIRIGHVPVYDDCAFPLLLWYSVNDERDTIDLPKNWEASGSPKPTITAINGAIECIGNVASLGFETLSVPFVAPMADGGVQLEWDHGDRHLEIEVLPDGSMAYVMMRGRSEIDSYGFHGIRALPYLFGRLMAAAR